MSIFFLITLLLVSLLNAERLQTQFEGDDELLMQRSAAASYLFGVPMRHYPASSIDSSSLFVRPDTDDQPRAKRIYWENLAFHATDYSQKAKKPKKSI